MTTRLVSTKGFGGCDFNVNFLKEALQLETEVLPSALTPKAILSTHLILFLCL